MLRTARIAALVAIVILFGTMRVAGQECDGLKEATSDQLVSYLNGIVPDQGNGECLTFVIKTLGRRRYEPAIFVLTRLLDFRRPPNTLEKEGVFMHLQIIEEIYPAAGALEEIGKKALPEVLTVIKATTSTRARENAVAVWMELYKYERPNGIAALREEAQQAEDTPSKQNLIWALSKALTWCSPPEEHLCKAAAKPRKS